MKNLFIIILSFSICLFFNGCIFDKQDTQEVIVSNKSEDTIYSILSTNDTMGSSFYYDEYRKPEESVKTKADSLWSFKFQPIAPGTQEASHDRYQSWDTFFKKAIDKKGRVFIIRKDSIDKYGWQRIFDKQVYNKMYLFKKEDIKDNKWTITYN
jgi:hypothetical protein